MKIKNIFFQIIFLILLFQQAIIEVCNISIINSLVSGIDEIITVMFIAIIGTKLLKYKKIHLLKYEIRIIICWIVIVTIGVISNMNSTIQPLKYAVVDILLCSKFIIGYMGIRIVFGRRFNADFLQKNLTNIIKIITIILFALTLYDYIFNPIFNTFDIRYGIRSTQLFFPHPSYLAASCILLISILAMNINKKGIMKYIIILSFIICSTLRGKAIAFVAVFYLIYFMIIKFKVKSKAIIVCSTAIGAFYFGYNQINEYFFTTSFSPRKIMLLDSIKIARRYLPIGAGFGTFGSHVSVIHYSKLYEALGYQMLDGMGSTGAEYLNDGFWQIIIGQFGFLGLILFLYLILTLFLMVLKLKRVDLCNFIAMILILIYMLILSVAETAFFHPVAFLFFLVLGIMVSQTLQLYIEE